jgi:hypothetical protein
MVEGRTMKSKTIVKRVIQAVAVGFGLLGAIWICMGVYFPVVGIRASDLFALFFMTPMFLILGGIVVAIAWQALRHFGPNAIRNVVGLVAYAAYTGAIAWLHPYLEASRRPKENLWAAAMVFGSMLLVYLLYRTLSRRLIEMTRPDASDQAPDHPVDPGGHGPTAG